VARECFLNRRGRTYKI